MNIYEQPFQESHIITTNDPRFIKFGVSSFTAVTLQKILFNIKNQIQEYKDDDFYQKLDSMSIFNQYSLNDNYLTTGDALGLINYDIININFLKNFFTTFQLTQFSYKIYNQASISFKTVTVNSDKAADYIKDFEKNIKILNTAFETRNEFRANRKNALNYIKTNIYPIQNSKDGCLEIKYKVSYINANDEFFMKIFFLSNQKQNKASNTVTSRGAPLFTDVPRSPTGRKYSLQHTNNADIGLYIPDSNDDDNLSDITSAPLRMTYNNALGMWECTQQILARLVTDLDPVQNNAFELPPEDADGYLYDSDVFKEYYNNEESRYGGNYTTALAVPVSTEENKSELFGPNFIRDYEVKTRVEKIKVTNRSNKTFYAGELVMCTLIGSEWIVQEFGKDIPDTSTKLLNWEFCKLIANSDAFFRAETGELWTFEEYERRARDAWYRKWSDDYGTEDDFKKDIHTNSAKVRDNNLERDSDGNIISKLLFNPHRSYLHATSFDSIEYTKYTNFDEAVNKSADFGLLGRFIPYWGPAFPDGYKDVHLGETGGIGNNNSISVGEGGEFSSTYWSKTPINLNNLKFDLNNIPADIALNSPDSAIMPIDTLMKDIPTDIVKAYRDYYDNGAWLDGWALKPLNPNRIHFSPLPAELVINTDSYAVHGKDERKNIKINYLNSIFDIIGKDVNMMKRMFTRYSNFRTNIGRPLCDTSYDTAAVSNADLDIDIIPYDCFIRKAPLSKPAGIPRYINIDSDEQNNGLNTVGIIAAITTFSRKNGGSVTIEVDQSFGLRTQKTVTGSSGSVSILLGAIINAIAPSIREFAIPMWGSSSDNYNVFGTTALHVRIFDYWPPEDTVYDPRYFAVLHFNCRTEDEDGNCSVDFPVPTKIAYRFIIPTTGEEKKIYELADTSDELSSSELLALEKDKNLWIKDKIRRGKLLTGPGFKYKKRTMSVSSKTIIVIRGENEKDEDLGLNKTIYGIKNKKLSFKLISTPKVGLNFFNFDDIAFEKDEFNNITSGEDFLPDDFLTEFEFINPLTFTGLILDIGTESKIIFYPAIRDIELIDLPPKQHGGVKRLTSSSELGQVKVEGANSVEISLEQNTTNKYQAYFFFHNDITHTLMLDYWGSQIPGYLQYVIANIK